MAGTHFQGPLYVNISGNAYARSVPYVLAQMNTPVVLLSSATFADTTGLITGLTALPYTPSGVVQVFVFAGAGIPTSQLYYAVFSGPTACQLYEPVSSAPAVPGTTKPSGITVGAYAGGTTAVTLWSTTLPAGALGVSGRLRVSPLLTYTNPTGGSANKVTNLVLGGLAAGGYTITTNTVLRPFFEVQAVSNGSAYIGTNFASAGGGMNATDWFRRAVNLNVDQTLAITGQSTVATDYQILEALIVEVLPS